MIMYSYDDCIQILNRIRFDFHARIIALSSLRRVKKADNTDFLRAEKNFIDEEGRACKLASRTICDDSVRYLMQVRYVVKEYRQTYRGVVELPIILSEYNAKKICGNEYIKYPVLMWFHEKYYKLPPDGIQKVIDAKIREYRDIMREYETMIHYIEGYRYAFSKRFFENLSAFVERDYRDIAKFINKSID